MSSRADARNAFSGEYLSVLRDRNEPDAGGVGQGALVLQEKDGMYALFRSWQSFEAGDVPEAVFETREDAQLFLAARSTLGRTRMFGLREGGEEGGFPLEKLGRSAGRLRLYEPDWVLAAHVLAAAAHSPEDLAVVMDIAGPTGQEEVGEILGRTAFP